MDISGQLCQLKKPRANFPTALRIQRQQAPCPPFTAEFRARPIFLTSSAIKMLPR